MPNTQPARRPRLAVILTEYGATSHGLCYCTKLLEGKQFDDHFEAPRCEVAPSTSSGSLFERVDSGISSTAGRDSNVTISRSAS